MLCLFAFLLWLGSPGLKIPYTWGGPSWDLNQKHHCFQPEHPEQPQGMGTGRLKALRLARRHFQVAHREHQGNKEAQNNFLGPDEGTCCREVAGFKGKACAQLTAWGQIAPGPTPSGQSQGQCKHCEGNMVSPGRDAP